jgi:hypothetical protein
MPKTREKPFSRLLLEYDTALLVGACDEGDRLNGVLSHLEEEARVELASVPFYEDRMPLSWSQIYGIWRGDCDPLTERQKNAAEVSWSIFCIQNRLVGDAREISSRAEIAYYGMQLILSSLRPRYGKAFIGTQTRRHDALKRRILEELHINRELAKKPRALWTKIKGGPGETIRWQDKNGIKECTYAAFVKRLRRLAK